MRTISAIAREISTSWKNISPYARPYLSAMLRIDSTMDMYGCDDGKDIVMRFLVNASGWRGEDARRIKAELKKMI
jgi:hypothetical protein